MDYAIVILFVTAMWGITFPALLANIQSIGDTAYALENYRENLGMCMVFGLLPPMWILAPFLTGFYKYGFQIGPRRPMDSAKS